VVRTKRPGGTRPFRFPRRCPACGGLTLRPESEAYWRCVNSACPAQLKERLRHFASRGAMDIEHLGDVTIDALVERRLVRDFADLYHLRAEQLRTLPGFGSRAADNVIAAIAGSKPRGLGRLLNALGIRLVGAHVARLLAEHFHDLDRLTEADAADVGRVQGIGPAIAQSVTKFFAERANREVCRRLAAAGVSVVERAHATRGPHAGKTFVLTGALATLTREQAAERIRTRGGRVSESVSRATDYVVVGAEPGDKLTRARSLGIRTLGERAFLALVG
jgi:DNA ligase (NAD+)